MKKLIFLLVFIALVAGVGGYFGLVPGVSSLFGTNKPRDLGIRYTEADLASGRGKSQIIYETLPEGTAPEKSWQTVGQRKIDTTFSSAEITAVMNNKVGRYSPYKNVQLKFNADGSGEISGSLVKSRLPLYGSTFGAPSEAVSFAMKFLPENPVFYLKGKATLEGNKVGVFEPQRFEIGRVPLPLDLILAFGPLNLVKETYALDITGLTSELSKIDNKRALIIDFINSRLSAIPGFYAESAGFAEDQLIYKGTLPEKELTVR